MSALADVRPMTVHEVESRLDEIVDGFERAGVTLGEAQQDRYSLTAIQRAEVEEYEDLSLILSERA